MCVRQIYAPSLGERSAGQNETKENVAIISTCRLCHSVLALLLFDHHRGEQHGTPYSQMPLAALCRKMIYI